MGLAYEMSEPRGIARVNGSRNSGKAQDTHVPMKFRAAKGVVEDDRF